MRSANHVKEAALAGADVATIPTSMIKSLADHVLTEKGVAQFTKHWAARRKLTILFSNRGDTRVKGDHYKAALQSTLRLFYDLISLSLLRQR